MTVQRFISLNQASWDRLAALLERLARNGPRRLTTEEVRDCARLYRKTVADLAYARSHAAGHPIVRQLEVLAGKAHAQTYRSAAPSGRSWAAFYRTEFPRLFRATFSSTLAAAALFFAFAVAGWVMTLRDPDFAGLLVPPELMAHIEAGTMWTVSINAVRPLASSEIATNNISVCLSAFALGVTLGVGSAWMMAFNGTLLGTLLALSGLHGMQDALLAFVLPHGVIEIPVIFISGGAGLAMGRALLLPGRHGRRDEFMLAARRGADLMLGCAPLLLYAGAIEAYVSPAPLPLAARMVVAAANAAGLAYYLLKAGSGASPPDIFARSAA